MIVNRFIHCGKMHMFLSKMLDAYVKSGIVTLIVENKTVYSR
jgi:hypothetical protein